MSVFLLRLPASTAAAGARCCWRCAPSSACGHLLRCTICRSGAVLYPTRAVRAGAGPPSLLTAELAAGPSRSTDGCGTLSRLPAAPDRISFPPPAGVRRRGLPGALSEALRREQADAAQRERPRAMQRHDGLLHARGRTRSRRPSPPCACTLQGEDSDAGAPALGGGAQRGAVCRDGAWPIVRLDSESDGLRLPRPMTLDADCPRGGAARSRASSSRKQLRLHL